MNNKKRLFEPLLIISELFIYRRANNLLLSIKNILLSAIIKASNNIPSIIYYS